MMAPVLFNDVNGDYRGTDKKVYKEKLEGAIDYAWVHAEELRPQLLESARCQIEWGHAGYHRIFELVESRKGKS